MIVFFQEMLWNDNFAHRTGWLGNPIRCGGEWEMSQRRKYIISQHPTLWSVRVIQFHLLLLLLKYRRCLCPVSHNCYNLRRQPLYRYSSPSFLHHLYPRRLNAFLPSSPLWWEHHDYQIVSSSPTGAEHSNNNALLSHTWRTPFSCQRKNPKKCTVELLHLRLRY